MKERFMKIALCDDGVFVFESILNNKKSVVYDKKLYSGIKICYTFCKAC